MRAGATGWRRGLAALFYAARVALVVGVLLVWTIQGLLPAWRAWQAAAQTPSAAGVSYDAQRLTLDGNTLYPLLAAARTACPAPRPVLALSDDVRAYQQGNYFLYPRRVDVIAQADAFSAADLTGHGGRLRLHLRPLRWPARPLPFPAYRSDLHAGRLSVSDQVKRET